MTTYLSYTLPELEVLRAEWTAKEINQQPECWAETFSLVKDQMSEITLFLNRALSSSNVRVILTGAGTSAFAGKSIAPLLSKYMKIRVEDIATTDLVANPTHYLAEDIPTILVSFARSGNSPESLAAVELADQCLSNVYHLILTCNAQGSLYKSSQEKENACALLMPAATNDQSFAMTSSFSSMMLACLQIFLPEIIVSKKIESICKCSVRLLKDSEPKIRDTANIETGRVIYLGSGCLAGLAQESSLKLLELTAGEIVATYDTPLGFRHGPKSIVDNNTTVIIFISNDPYTRRYDLDLLNELRKDNIAKAVIAIAASQDDNIDSGQHLYISDMSDADDVELLFPYLLFAQIYAFHKSLALKKTPDNPCPTGEVNRVVQGVIIHKLCDQY